MGWAWLTRCIGDCSTSRTLRAELDAAKARESILTALLDKALGRAAVETPAQPLPGESQEEAEQRLIREWVQNSRKTMSLPGIDEVWQSEPVRAPQPKGEVSG